MGPMILLGLLSVGLLGALVSSGSDDPEETDTVPVEETPDPGTGFDLLKATEDDDILGGTEGADDIRALGGNDLVAANDGRDTVAGAGGDDLIYGGAGADDIDGGSGADVIYAGTGADTLQGSAGADAIYADVGNDLANGGADNDSIYGYEGDDTLGGDLGDDLIVDEYGADSLSGGFGQDELNAWDLPSGPAADTVSGGDGDDLLKIDNGDVATGGAGADEFVKGYYVNDANAPLMPEDQAAVTLTDFNPAEDGLEIGVFGPVAGGYTLTPTPDGTGTEVRVGGEVQAVLTGVAPGQITPAAIRLLDLRIAA